MNAKTKNENSASEVLLVKPVQPRRMQVTIVGKSPLIQHAWTEKAKRQIRDKQGGKKTKNREARDPKAEFTGATWRMPDGRPAIPAGAIAAAMVNAAHKDLGIEKTLVRKAVFILPEDKASNLLPLIADEPVMREDMVRIGAGTSDLRYRPMFENWEVTFMVEFDPDLMQPADIINLLNKAGFGVGLLEWRPQRGGDFGRFEVKADEEV